MVLSVFSNWWKTNRLITREHASVLDVGSRIQLEKELTDAEAQEAKPLSIPPTWQFDDYHNLSPWRAHLFQFLGCFKDLTIVDLGCGYHPTPILFALAGAKKVYACDVSPKAVAHVQNLAESAGVADKVSAIVCAAERMALASEQIDVIHGEAVLHHLHLPSAGAELARVLKNGGKAGFKDPLGQNPLLELVRDYVPYRWKKSAKGTDRPLKFKDIEEFGQHFAHCSYRGFGLLSTLTYVICGRGDSKLQRVIHRLDGYLLRALPFLQRFCRFVVTCVDKNELETPR